MDKLTIVLTFNEWNNILAILAKQPYEVSAALIQQIQAQAQQQASQNQQSTAASMPVSIAANGALSPVPPAVEFDQRRD